MNPQRINDAWAGLAKKHGLPALAPAQLRRQREPHPDPTPTWQRFQDCQPREGWVQFQSCVVAFNHAKLPQPAPDWGLLLAAEAVTADGRSLLVRQQGRGGLLLVIATPGAGDGAEAFLADEVSQLATGRVAGLPGVGSTARLHYRRYWGHAPALGFAPVFAAFIGFANP